MITYSFEPTPKKLDVLIVPVFADKKPGPYVKEVNEMFDGQLFSVMDRGDFEGTTLQTSLLYSSDANVPRVLLIGLGKSRNFSVRRWNQVVGTATIAMTGKKFTSFGVVVPKEVCKKLGTKKAMTELAVSLEMADYAFDTYKEEKAKVTHVKSVQVLGLEKKEVKSAKAGVEDGQGIALGANFTRDLGNTSPSHMTPARLAKEAEEMAAKHKKMSVKILGKKEIEKLKMGCFLGVAQGSELEPKFIILEYNPSAGSGRGKKEKPYVLVGKGITFDSGGLSIKPANYMTDMKYDMLGAATVLGTMHAAATLGLKKHIVGLVPTCENMPSGTAFRPDDVLTNMNGKTVEIGNTDAEGRLILSDALSYAKRYEPKEVINFATLTGACVVALGQERSGLFTPVDRMAEKLYKSAVESGEHLWRLPLGEEYSEAMKSQVADISNISSGRYGGASTAAAFLQYWTIDHEKDQAAYPWAHIDLSSSYIKGKGKPWMRYGANGFGVQTMISYLR